MLVVWLLSLVLLLTEGEEDKTTGQRRTGGRQGEDWQDREILGEEGGVGETQAVELERGREEEKI